MRMKKATEDLIAEVPGSISRIEMTIGIDLGDVWSHYCTLNEEGEVVDRGRFRTTPTAVERWFTDPCSSSAPTMSSDGTERTPA
jgi:transposase